MKNQPSKIAISVQNLTKSFKDNQVLKGVNFTVHKGSIFALLGSNGAGKTTTIKILSTLSKADGGKAEIYGHDVAKEPAQVRRHISLTGQFAALDENLTGRENLQTIGALRHLSNVNQRADKLLEDFRLTSAAKKLVSQYSGGMRRRLDIAMSMMGDSPVVFLDEPTTGLDPQNRLAMWEIVKSMANAGTTILLTTQYLDEAESLADYIAILHEGTIVAEGTVDALKERLPQGIVQLQFKNDTEFIQANELLSGYKIRDGEGVHSIEIQTTGGTKPFADILNQLNQAKIEPAKFAPKQPTLEDAFLTLIGEKAAQTARPRNEVRKRSGGFSHEAAGFGAVPHLNEGSDSHE